jgi:hypothetical protein
VITFENIAYKLVHVSTESIDEITTFAQLFVFHPLKSHQEDVAHSSLEEIV